MNVREIKSTFGTSERAISAWWSGPFLISLSIGEGFTRFQTLDGDPSVATNQSPRDAIVLPIRKREGNAFERMISIGRVKIVDLHVDSPSVSKMHAYFSYKGEQLQIVDTGSHNGTYLNGYKIEAKKAVSLSIGDELAFGRHDRFCIADAKTLAHFLKNADSSGRHPAVAAS